MEAGPGACILYGPPTRQWYSGGGRAFTHDWFHFIGSEAQRVVKRSTFPIGRIVYPGVGGFITDTVRVMYGELVDRDPGWDEVIAAHVRLLFTRMRRALVQRATTPTRAKALSLQRLKDLRLALHRIPEHPWSVGEMADNVGLSRSRFSALYKEHFGASPMEDVIRLRLERARWLLSNSAFTVTQIARQVGFEDAAYFNRLFRRRVGVSPGRYR